MVPGEGYHFTGHTPSGTLNITADEESRIMKDRTDWMLCPRTFREINHLLGPLQVDMFASRLTHQPHRYASWRLILLPNKPDLIQPTCTVNNLDIPCNPTFSRVDYLRDTCRFRSQELSEDTSTLLLASWRHKTAKSYDSLCGKWVGWYSERGTDPISGNIL